MRKTALGCTILEGHDIADLPLVSENSEILEKEIKRIEQEGGKVKSVNGKTGEVVLKGEDIKLNNGKNIEEKLRNIDEVKAIFQISGVSTDRITYVATEPGITQYYKGLTVLMTPTMDSTGKPTLNINGYGAKEIRLGDLYAGQFIFAGYPHLLSYNGNYWNLLSVTTKDYTYIRENTRGTLAKPSGISLNSVTTDFDKQANVSFNVTLEGRNSQSNASANSKCSGSYSQINSSTGECLAYGDYSQINSSTNGSRAMGNYSQVNSCSNGYSEGILSQVNCSSASTASGDYSQINASYDASEASGDYSQVNSSKRGKATGSSSQVNASNFCTASGDYSQVNASKDSQANGINTAIIASTGSTTENKQDTSTYCAILGSSNCTIKGSGAVSNGYQNILSSNVCISQHAYSTIISSFGITSNDAWTVVGGLGQGSASTKNRKWDLSSLNGTIRASGTITQNYTFTDYAEYFESIDGKAIPTGTLVTLEGDKIRIAQAGDEMLGVISETAGVVLGACGFHWQDRYLRNEFGGLIYEIIKDPSWQPPIERKPIYEKEINPETGEEERFIDYEEIELPYTEDDIPNITVPIENPEHNMEEEYVPREERDEWNIVGLMGQVYIKCDDTLKVGDYIKVGRDGMATKDDNPTYQRWKVMKVTTPYSEEKGYGVALVFIR